MIHATKGIVLRTVKYGDTSIVTTVYTELFGIQTYLVKGVRQSSKTSSGKASYFQPAAMLDLQVYHHPQKQLQYIKEYQWSFLYQKVLFDVVRNTIAQYLVELLQLCLKQPEANPELFYVIQDSLQQLDKGSDTLASNLPLFFTLQLAAELGFQIQGNYSMKTPVLDLREGGFVAQAPLHPYFLEGMHAKISSELNALPFYNQLDGLQLNKTIRRELLQAYHTYLSLHIADLGNLKSFPILQEVLS